MKSPMAVLPRTGFLVCASFPRMRLLLVCFQTLALGLVPTLGTPHSHSGSPDHGDALEAAVSHHAHGIGLEHGGEHNVGHSSAPDSEGETQNLDADRLFTYALKAKSAGSGSLTARRLLPWSRVSPGVSDAPRPRAVCSEKSRPPSPGRQQVEVRQSATRRGPPIASV